ncbi:heavy metal-(Cd/Co/Hg/Pb/Zn)-translocating P-type ATPase [Dietzia kunjamensis subsp. schimae]|uniref:Heavy metal-(Cd/Co/Hg/Pb/Zn)-translocating P-type ATPase n=1 Tax=Dietzia kunjamensis subsp. schimae TaxID=498198 RepID=A0ABY1N3X8_9ACTN|nr:heavy metal translocating P-type ATPase [Dietzia kunjamensis]MBB1015550.1 cadmium-translocating P-type ATPase [Dietzia kunjamensis subsp. schimae]SMO85159.1 heavy metal-(Cd/Co/Hg/Pb/Zn)-translocating P-type ATPase [Dietzia kunjamensis subsp. schimae]
MNTTRDGALRTFVASRQGVLVMATVLAIAVHLIARASTGLDVTATGEWIVRSPLVAVVVVGGVPLIIGVVRSAVRSAGGADMLAAVSIVTAVLLSEWLVAAIIVLMLSGGEALEAAASRRASATLDALAQRSPTLAHRLRGTTPSEGVDDLHADDVRVGDLLLVLPHELCPVDGEVVEGDGAMDESYLTGEPYVVPKSPGSQVLSGAVNGDTALTVRAALVAADSRYAQIVGVLREAEEHRPPMRRLADRLGAWYTLVALTLGVLGWAISGDPTRFLAVVVVATPCPLLIGVPVAIIGAISLAAKRGIIIKNPSMLEEVARVETMMFDKTGTLTYGRPVLTEVIARPGADPDDVLAAAAAVEVYSRHPLARAVVDAATERGLDTPPLSSVTERPGAGLIGEVGGRSLRLTNRRGLASVDPEALGLLPVSATGMESVVLVDDRYAATLRFRDEPRATAGDFIAHLPRAHGVKRMMIISGDREAEVRRLADRVGISEVYGGVSPEGKLAIVRERTAAGPTLFLGDGINDAPAMTAATAGVAFGATSDVTSEAADAVVLDSSLERLDDLLHIGARMRRIALQSAVGGMAASVIGMLLAVFGLLSPLAGAIAQEVIDVLAILNSARVVMAPRKLSDFDTIPEQPHDGPTAP